MSLSFLHPWALSLLPAAALPWLLHRWSRRPAVPRPFPALELVREALRSAFGTGLISHRWLMILRTLIALFVVLFLAGPRVRRGGGPATGDGALVLVMDVSYSMGARAAGRTALEWAAAEARAFLPEGLQSPPVGVVAFSDRVERVWPLTRESSVLRQALASLSPTDRPTAAGPALAAAEGLLPEGGHILLFTDGASNAWAGDIPDGKAGLVVAESAPLQPNAALTGAVFSAEGGRLEASSWGGGVDRDWTLSWDGALRAQGRLTWKDGRSSVVLPRAHGLSDVSTGEVRLSPDALSIDDVRYLSPPSSRALSVLIVNGAPGLSPATDEAFFLTPALDSLGGSCRTRSLSPALLETDTLEGVDVVLLLNAPALSVGAAGRLRSFVERGGGLWVTAGDRFAPGFLEPLLPARGAGFVPSPEGAALGPGNGTVVRRLSEDGGFAWDSVRIEKALSLSPLPGAEVVASVTPGGAPLLVVGRAGRGRVALWGTSVDRDWNNLPARPIFPALVREVLRELSGRGEGGGDLTVDEVWEIPIPSGAAGPFRVERPDGRVDMPEVRGGRLRYALTDRAGRYVLRDGGDAARSVFSANVQSGSGESDPARVDLESLRRRLGARPFLWIPYPGPVRQAWDARVRGLDLGPLLGLLAVLLLAAETFLAARLRRS